MAMLKEIIMVGAGGAAGSIARYLTARWLQPSACFFPWGTFAVNILGCFLIGLIYGLIDRGMPLPASCRLLLVTGFCGGFTTFSTFVHENYRLIGSSEILTMAVYASASLLLGLLAAHAAHLLTRLF